MRSIMMLVSTIRATRPSKLTNVYVVDKPEFFAGAPLSLQIVSRRFNDELVMDAVTRVDRVLRGAQ